MSTLTSRIDARFYDVEVTLKLSVFQLKSNNIDCGVKHLLAARDEVDALLKWVGEGMPGPTPAAGPETAVSQEAKPEVVVATTVLGAPYSV